MYARRAVVLCLAAAIGGCSSLGGRVQTTFSESVTDPADQTTVTTAYRAESRAGLFGKLDTSNHEFRYAWDGENEIATGQSAAGQDNAGNQMLLQVMSELMTLAIQQAGTLQAQKLAVQAALAEAQLAAQATGTPVEPWMRLLTRLMSEAGP